VEATHPYSLSLLVDDVVGLPAMSLMNAEFDPLRGEPKAYWRAPSKRGSGGAPGSLGGWAGRVNAPQTSSAPVNYLCCAVSGYCAEAAIQSRALCESSTARRTSADSRDEPDAVEIQVKREWCCAIRGVDADEVLANPGASPVSAATSCAA
jgi:hypothetical protein